MSNLNITLKQELASQYRNGALFGSDAVVKYQFHYQIGSGGGVKSSPMLDTPEYSLAIPLPASDTNIEITCRVEVDGIFSSNSGKVTASLPVADFTPTTPSDPTIEFNLV